jgi:membrane protease YdiL (CAAX protease family)
MPATAATVATAIEFALMGGGLWLTWKVALSPAARAQPPAVKLEEWPLPLAEFLRFLLLVVCATLAGNLVGTIALSLRPVGTDARAMVLTAFSQAGMFAGIAFFKVSAERLTWRDVTLRLRDLLAGGAIFMIALPFVMAANVSWIWVLKAAGLRLEKQELVDMFVHARSPVLLAFMILLATLTAPATEELLFRGGFFRYMRTRVPRWAALAGPACLFAALHQHVASFLPLIVLGVIFALAYERVGRIAPVIVAHALFNLNTIVLLLCGVGV